MMAASAVLTLIYFKLSVKSFLNLARGLRERAESVHVTCGPFLSVTSLREPETGPQQYLFFVLLSTDGCGQNCKRCPTLSNTTSNF